MLTEYVRDGELTPHQAINITKDLLFNNANILYDLRFQVEFNEMAEPKSLPWRPRESSPLKPAPIPHPATILTSEPEHTVASPTFPPPPKTPQVYDIRLFEEFMEAHPETKYIHVQWLDYMATIRARILPIKQFERMIRSHDRIGISTGNLGTLQNDTMTSLCDPVGQILVEPDLRSLRPTHKEGPRAAATVFSYWRDSNGRPLPICPRTMLEHTISDLQFNHRISMLCGFEIEVTFFRHDYSDPSSTYTSLTQAHAWGSLTPEDWLNLPWLCEMIESLEEMGIEVQQLHSESGTGQYEFVLGPQAPLHAVDTLLQARQAIQQVAAMHGLRATMHPQPFADSGAGSGAHVHLSLNPPAKEMDFFVGGVLKHLPALCAFTLPQESSYSRVRDNSWTGGTWVAWGTQNRETPLRKVQDGRWEVRCVDGFANMYFALTGIVGAGLLGLKEGADLHPSDDDAGAYKEKDVPTNPTRLSEEELEQFGVTRKMPMSTEEAVKALEEDTALKETLGGSFLHQFLIMKDHERTMLGAMSDDERLTWLLERY